jgi:hypothetical protein
MFGRLIDRLCIQTLAPAEKTAVARFKDIVIQDGSSFALSSCLSRQGGALSRFIA